jgi:hypothetical protein
MPGRNIDVALADLERRMAALEVPQASQGVEWELPEDHCLEVALVFAEIALVNDMTYPEALVWFTGCAPEEAQTIAQVLGPVAEQRIEERMSQDPSWPLQRALRRREYGF